MGNRKFVFIPQINPKTFLFFYHEGSSGKSFSFREYAPQGKSKTTYAKAFPSLSADQILQMAKHVFDAPTHPTTDNEFWYAKINELNNKYLAQDKSNLDKIVVKDPIIPPRPVSKLVPETAFCIKGKNNTVINSVEDWHRYAPPKKADVQWRDGKSAKELAQDWFRKGKLGMSENFRLLLKSNPITANFDPHEGFAEYRTSLDDFGEPRNHDLLLIGSADNRRILIGVEAKETEEFSSPIDQIISDNPRSNIGNRKKLLSEQIFGRSIDNEIGAVRYQLITGTAGTLIEAKNRNSDYAVFILHVFLTSRSDIYKAEKNSFEVDRFLKVLTKNRITKLKSGSIVEIGCLPGGHFVPNDIPLLIGKVTTEL